MNLKPTFLLHTFLMALTTLMFCVGGCFLYSNGLSSIHVLVMLWVEEACEHVLVHKSSSTNGDPSPTRPLHLANDLQVQSENACVNNGQLHTADPFSRTHFFFSYSSTAKAIRVASITCIEWQKEHSGWIRSMSNNKLTKQIVRIGKQSDWNL